MQEEDQLKVEDTN